MNNMNHIIFVHEHNLNKEDLAQLMDKIYDYLVEINELQHATKIIIKVIIIAQLDQTYAEVNTFTDEGINYEDYFDL